MQRPKSNAAFHRRWFPALVVIAGGCSPAPSKGCDSAANPIPSALHDCVHDHDDWIATQNVHRNVIVALSEAATAVSDMNRVAAHFRQTLIYSKLPAASAEEAAALTWTF